MEQINEIETDTQNIYNPLLNIKFKIYTYITLDNKPGTLIVHPDLSPAFDTQVLFQMDKLTVTEVSLRDILNKGFVKLGDTDTMDKLDIEYPLIQNQHYRENRIIGKHMDVSNHDINNMLPNIDLSFEETSDSYSEDSDVENSDNINENKYVDLDNHNEENNEEDLEEPYIEPDIELKVMEGALDKEKVDKLLNDIDKLKAEFDKIDYPF
jgi:hypothetical protein